MLRRHLSGVLGDRDGALTWICGRTFFFGGQQKNTGKGSASTSHADTAVPSSSGLPVGADLQKLKVLQDLLKSQSPEKQAELMKQAMELPKLLGKVPGLGKMVQKNAALMEQLLSMQNEAEKGRQQKTMEGEVGTGNATSKFSGSSSPNAAENLRSLFPSAGAPSSGNGSKNAGGPTLDELQRVNLGSEIEALFSELRTIRNKKNEYRDELHRVKETLSQMKRDHDKLAATEANVRSKLKKAEQDVLLLTSENMELKEHDAERKRLQQSNQSLCQQLRHHKEQEAASTAAGSVKYETLQQQLQGSEDALRSLQRKVDRMRRRDPLLQFSLACSEVARLCVGSNDTCKEEADESFSRLQESFQKHQQEAWRIASADGAAAAKAFSAVARRYVSCCVPHAQYDAMITLQGDVAAARGVFEAAGFTAHAVPGDASRMCVTAPADAGTLTTPGPYGYAFAIKMASTRSANRSVPSSSPPRSFTITVVHPYVSETLVANPARCTVTLETARASGPGGQATNVSETQVYATLTIDGSPVYTAEAQDTRSALTNRESAVEKLANQRRQQYNETLSKQNRFDEVRRRLLADVMEKGGLKLDEQVMELVQEAVRRQSIPEMDAYLVQCLEALTEEHIPRN